ncbi:MAG: TIGR01777 family oxidoreductase [Actinomycetes bacterium]
MKVALTGASGLIGTALVANLTADGHEVVRFVRRPTRQPDEAQWDPEAGSIDSDALLGVDAVVHLAGAGIGDRRWSDERKRVILRSRVDGTSTLARALSRMDPLPSVLVSASAIGYYGDTEGRTVDESGPKGTGFAADVAQAWEQAAEPARVAGIRVVHPRSGLVMTRQGGAWGRMLPLFRLGLGGHLGDGRQYWSYITLADEVRGLRFLIDHDLSGPVNLTVPEAVTNDELTKEIGRALHRPTALPVPAFALRTVLGEFSSEVLSSARVQPKALTEAGFRWEHPDLRSAVATLT